jgi:hypothetical protein
MKPSLRSECIKDGDSIEFAKVEWTVSDKSKNRKIRSHPTAKSQSIKPIGWLILIPGKESRPPRPYFLRIPRLATQRDG